MTKEELAKMLLIYQYMFMTKDPSDAVKVAKKKLKKQLRMIMTNKEKLYNDARELQKKVYSDAWNKLFTKGGTYISLGTFITKIYNSIEKQKLVGHQVMKRMFDSYHHSDSKEEITKENEVEMECNAHNLADEILVALDGKKDNPLARRKKILEQNLIIEGKIA